MEEISEARLGTMRPEQKSAAHSWATEGLTKPRETLKDYLWRSSKWILLFSVASTLLAAVPLRLDPIMYSARVVMLARDGNHQEAVQELLAPNAPADRSRLFHLATSTAMFEHLIQRFNLYAHYGIDTLQPYASELAMNSLIQSIRASEPEGTCLVVTVDDTDRKMASDLANEVYAELRRMAEGMARSRIEQTVELYAQVIKATEQDLESQMKRLSELIVGSNGQGTAIGTRHDPNSTSFQLAKLVAEVGTVNQDLAKAQRVQAITLALANTDHTPEVLLVRRAQEDISISPPLRMAQRLIIVAVLSLLGALFVATIWFLHRREFKEFLLSTDDPQDR